MSNLNFIIKQLEKLTNDELLTIHNEYCNENNCLDNMIFENDEEFFEIHFSSTLNAVRAVSFGEYEYQDKYVRFDGYANLESSNYVDEFADIDELASWIEEEEKYDEFNLNRLMYIIQDWTGNRKFPEEEFETAEDAHEFLSMEIEEEEELQEFYVVLEDF